MFEPKRVGMEYPDPNFLRKAFLVPDPHSQDSLRSPMWIPLKHSTIGDSLTLPVLTAQMRKKFQKSLQHPAVPVFICRGLFL